LERGLNISWKSDVTSKQEKYVVVYVRNDTGRPTNIETIKPKIKLDNLYPGAGYEIKVIYFCTFSMFCILDFYVILRH
jgi:receptor-type tyrosine-protein phosphatase beta